MQISNIDTCWVEFRVRQIENFFSANLADSSCNLSANNQNYRPGNILSHIFVLQVNTYNQFAMKTKLGQ